MTFKLFEERSGGMFALAFFIVVSLFMTYPLVLHMDDHIPVSLGDPYYNIWVMSWNRHAVSHASENILDTNIFYPHKRTLYYADPLILESVLNALLMLVWKNPIFTYNLLFFLSFVICGLGMYSLVHHLTGSRSAALLAGLIFSYFPNKFAHLTHLEILFFGWMPLVFLFLHKFFVRQKTRYLIGFVLFFVLQAASCSYYAVYTTLFVLIFVAYFAYKKGLFLKKDYWIKMAVASFLIVAALLPLFFPYMVLSQEMPFSRPLDEVKFYSAEPKDFFSVPSWNRAYKKLLAGEQSLEWQVFPGAIPLFLTLVWWLFRRRGKAKKSARQRWFLLWDVLNVAFLLFISWLSRGGGFDFSLRGRDIMTVHAERNPLILFGISIALRVYADRKNLWGKLKAFIKIPLQKRLGPKVQTDASLSQNYYFFSALLAALLVMGPVITAFGQEIVLGPYSLLYSFFPGFKGLRVPPRFIVFVMLGLSVLSAWGMAGLIRRKSSSVWKFCIPFLFGILVVVENFSVPIPLAPSRKLRDIPPIYKTIQKLPEKTVVLKFPMPREHELFRGAESMFYSIFHRKRLVNGYSGYFPPGYKIIREAMEFFPSRETFVLLNDLGVDYVLVQTKGYRPWLAKFAVERLDASSQNAELVEHQQNDYLYRLIKMEREPEEPDKQEPVERSRLWKAETNKNPDLARLAFDGDLTTGWSTGFHQEKNDYFTLDFGQGLRIRKVEFYLGQAFLDFPRGYKLQGSADGKNWVRLSERRFNFPRLTPSTIQDFSQYRVEMSFDWIEVRYLKISLVKSFEERNWSIYEIVCR